ncbi:hypothetical protein HQ590_04980 [bacterium]|nr:hypothetical protein [bacterium]
MLKNLHLWLPSYLARRRPAPGAGPTHVCFCFVDHFEPYRGQASPATARGRVEQWTTQYPALAARFRDADGRPPQHTFFYPAEEYDPECVGPLADLTARGFGEVEVHLHHRNDTGDGLTRTIEEFKSHLRRHGLLTTDAANRVRYGFVHGNWSLDNSRADGDWCGVNNELQVLRDTGCYADFTLPSAPSDTQTRQVNSVYYATDDPQRPKSHDTGAPVRVGGTASGDLLLVQGPLALNWRRRKWGVLPRIENAEIAGHNPASSDRVALWLRQRIGVEGRPDWLFVKVHTHGCDESNSDTAGGAGGAELHRCLQEHANDGRRFVLHYVTARELYNLVKAAEAGQAGDPHASRDFSLSPPPARR